MKTWMAKMEDNCLFISARERINIEELKSVVYKRVKELHVQSIPIMISFIRLTKKRRNNYLMCQYANVPIAVRCISK